MIDSKKGPPLRGLGTQEALYEMLGGALQGVLTRKFGIPRVDAEWLVCEVFMVFSMLDPAPPDARSWLIAGACRRAKEYLKMRGLTAGQDESEETVERLLRRDEALALLSERARRVLRLRFDERKTYAEIAAELGVTVRSAKRIVSAAAAELRGLNRRA